MDNDQVEAPGRHDRVADTEQHEGPRSFANDRVQGHRGSRFELQWAGGRRGEGACKSYQAVQDYQATYIGEQPHPSAGRQIHRGR